MTYQQYYNKLTNDIAEAKKHLTQQNKLLKGEKGYLDTQDMYTYMSLQHNLDSLQARCAEISKLITGGDVNPKSEVDYVRFSDAI